MVAPHVLTHPIRLRIVLALGGDRQPTTAQIAEEMPDVPPATLYRHIAALREAGVLDVVAERRVRGAVERTFALRPGGGLVGRAASEKMTPEQKSAAFGVFSAGLIAAYDGYLANPDAAGPSPRPTGRTWTGRTLGRTPGRPLGRSVGTGRWRSISTSTI